MVDGLGLVVLVVGLGVAVWFFWDKIKGRMDK